MLNPKYIRVPKESPLLELFSSKGGTFEFQGRNFRVPREELFSSSGGTFCSLGRDSEFPREENKISKGGKLNFQGWKFIFPTLERFWKSLENLLTRRSSSRSYLRDDLANLGRRKKKKGDSRTTSTITLSRDEKTRTSDLHVPNVARYQLCYIPMVDFERFAPRLPLVTAKVLNNATRRVPSCCRSWMKNSHGKSLLSPWLFEKD